MHRRLFLRSVVAATATLLTTLFLHAAGSGDPQSHWTKFSRAKLIANPFNDADSFHVEADGKHYVFRLYFVDAPETDRQVPSRVKEQAAYWNISEERSLALGKVAAELSNTLLQTNFTVYTKFQDARGAGRQRRHFAMIKVGKRYLSEILVERGLARIYGASAYKLPDRRISRTYWRHLRTLEKQAKRARRGGWGPTDRSRQKKTQRR